MEFPRKDNIVWGDTNKPLRFQIYDWYVPEADKSLKKQHAEFRKKGIPIEYPDEPAEYEIFMFGCTEDGHSVCAKATDFVPYFYVKIPERFTRVQPMTGWVNNFHNYLLHSKYYDNKYKYQRSIISYKYQSHLLGVDLVSKKEFYGFTNNADFYFMKISVKSLALFNNLRFFFKNPPKEFLDTYKEPFQLYESNLDPFLRFIHLQNIQPCGWVELPARSYQLISNGSEDDSFSRANFTVSTHYKNVRPYASNKTAPILIVSFDLECTSSHGDFPVANKDYRKLAKDLCSVAKNETFTSEQIQEAILKAYQTDVEWNNVKIHRLYALNNVYPDKIRQKLTTILPDIMEVMETVRKEHVEDEEDEGEEGEEVQKTTAANKFENENELNELLTKHLPKLQGDAIIQIGTSVHRYGSDDIIYKNIMTLKSCEAIEGVDVQSYSTEDALLLGWKGLIQRLDPDILTGYNIFGFDMPYLWARAQELGLTDYGVGFGRLSERNCMLLEQKLASSALGENLMYYIDMDGIVSIDVFKVMQRDHKLDSYKLDSVAQIFLGDQKNDLKPHEIFERYLGTSADRKVIAEYCIQDCCLVNRLFHKLKILENNAGMGNVCSVPLSYLFMRGQGIKIFSLVANECRKNNFAIPVLNSYREDKEDEVGYEGAIVLNPKEGMYLDDYIVTLDFASLYPSSMIERNLSHDCYVYDSKYDNLPDIDYKVIEYDIYEGKGDDKHVVDKKTCKFVQLPEEKKGIIPRILQALLKQRKVTRKKMEYETLTTKDGKTYIGLIQDKEDVYIVNDVEKGTSESVSKDNIIDKKSTYDPFEQAVLDALQLAYKVTANSLYGQIGSRTSPIYLKDIAACTTATGRERIMHAKKFVENTYGAEVIYGDTDSIFCRFKVADENGNKLKGLEGLAKAIEMGQKASNAINKILPAPQNLEYEKTFYPFIIFSKKRYVGNLYEDNAYKKPKQKSMGIALKRRDYAPIVKKIYGGIINILLNETNLQKSVQFLETELSRLVNNEYPIEDLIISKTLKSNYKNPASIAHKVLADRMTVRDPGNKPQVNDRIPYVYVQTPPNVEVKLQGDRIEHPEYIRDNGLIPDYQFYITNQLLKPICQLYALCVEQLPNYSYPPSYWIQMDEELKYHKNYGDERKRMNRIQALREKEVENLLFEKFIVRKTKKRVAVEKEAKKTKIPKHILTEESPVLCFQVSEVNNETKKCFTASCSFHSTAFEETIPKKGYNKTQACQTLLRNILKKIITEHKEFITEKGLRIEIKDTRFKNILKKSIDEYDQLYANIEKATQEGDIEALQTYQEMERNLIIAQMLFNYKYQFV